MTQSNFEGQSPLDEAKPESLEELFSRDPLDLTSDDVARIVSELRVRRSQWMTEETKARADERRPNSRKVTKMSVSSEEAKAMKPADLLGDLVLDL